MNGFIGEEGFWDIHRWCSGACPGLVLRPLVTRVAACRLGHLPLVERGCQEELNRFMTALVCGTSTAYVFRQKRIRIDHLVVAADGLMGGITESN